MRNIFVVGATGLLAQPLIKELLSEGFSVTGVVRNIDKSKSMWGDSIAHVYADLKIPETLLQALKGADVVYLNLSTVRSEKENDFHPESNGITNIIEAAKINDVKKILYLSSIIKDHNNGWWVFDVKRIAVELIKKSGLPYFLFYPSNFMESIEHQYRSGNKLFLIGESKYKVGWIAGADYGKIVAESLKLHVEYSDEFFVQGPDAYTVDEAFEIFKANYKRELKIVKFPVWLIKASGKFIASVDYGYKINDAINNYDESFKSEKTWGKFGKPEITLKEFASSI